jgi:hypothetical protein
MSVECTVRPTVDEPADARAAVHPVVPPADRR